MFERHLSGCSGRRDGAAIRIWEVKLQGGGLIYSGARSDGEADRYKKYSDGQASRPCHSLTAQGSLVNRENSEGCPDIWPEPLDRGRERFASPIY